MWITIFFIEMQCMDFIKHKRLIDRDLPLNVLLSTGNSTYEESLDKIVKEFMSLESEYIYERISRYSKLMSNHLAKIKIAQELKESLKLNGIFEQLSKAITCIIEYGEKSLKMEDWEALKNNLFSQSKNFKQSSKATLREELEITDESMQALDEIANDLFEKEKNSEVLAIRFLIAVLDPKKALNWTKLGIAHQINENYKEALRSYCCSMLFDPTDISTRFFAAECYLFCNQIDDAKLELEAAYELISQIQDNKEWKERLSSLELAINGL